jgi:hypothetical protein
LNFRSGNSLYSRGADAEDGPSGSGELTNTSTWT